jgi:hypothetical protein
MLHSLSPGHSVPRGQISVSADQEEQLWDRRHSGRCLAKHPEAKMASIASAFLSLPKRTNRARGRASPSPAVCGYSTTKLPLQNLPQSFTSPTAPISSVEASKR